MDVIILTLSGEYVIVFPLIFVVMFDIMIRFFASGHNTIVSWMGHLHTLQISFLWMHMSPEIFTNVGVLVGPSEDAC